jgi:hypothetical protein
MSLTAAWTVKESDYPASCPMDERLRFLIRYALLAPSSHNTQPWQFRIAADRIDVFTDEGRWLKVADKDQRELHISIGCALENLLIAAKHFGLAYRTEYLPDPANLMHAAMVRLSEDVWPSPSPSDDLFPMISVRHTNHGEYDGQAIPADVLARLSGCNDEPSVTLLLTPNEEIKRKVDELVVRADADEFANPAFREELGYWIGQGVFGTSWLMSKLSKLAVTYVNMGASIAKKDSAVLMSSPVLGLISSEKNDRVTQIKVGQLHQRLSLLAASSGLWCQPLSQIVEVEDIKQELSQLQANPALFPQHPFRLGFASPEKHHTPRRAVEDVLV